VKGLRTGLILKYRTVGCLSTETHRYVLYSVPQKGMEQLIGHVSVSIRIAQLEEHLIFTQRVAGSTPVSETILQRPDRCSTTKMPNSRQGNLNREWSQLARLILFNRCLHSKQALKA
jgi:hypothetical protein